MKGFRKRLASLTGGSNSNFNKQKKTTPLKKKQKAKNSSIDTSKFLICKADAELLFTSLNILIAHIADTASTSNYVGKENRDVNDNPFISCIHNTIEEVAIIHQVSMSIVKSIDIRVALLTILESTQPSVLCAVIKLTLQCLDRPVVPLKICNQLIDVINEKTCESDYHRVSKMQKIFMESRMDLNAKDILYKLLELFNTLSKNSKHDLQLLAYHYGPLLILPTHFFDNDSKKSNSTNEQMLKLLSAAHSVVKLMTFLIEHYEQVFSDRLMSEPETGYEDLLKHHLSDEGMGDSSSIFSIYTEDEQVTQGNQKAIFYVIAEQDFEAVDDDELQFKVGERIAVMRTDHNGWWWGRKKDGKDGIFPALLVRREILSCDSTSSIIRRCSSIFGIEDDS